SSDLSFVRCGKNLRPQSGPRKVEENRQPNNLACCKPNLRADLLRLTPGYRQSGCRSGRRAIMKATDSQLIELGNRFDDLVTAEARVPTEEDIPVTLSDAISEVTDC